MTGRKDVSAGDYIGAALELTPVKKVITGAKTVIKGSVALGDALIKKATKSGVKKVVKKAEKTTHFIADLSKTKAKTRTGHTNAGNKQLHEAMKEEPKLRQSISRKFGDDAFDRTSTSGGGRRNPRNGEWHHSKQNKNALELKTKEEHAQTHVDEGKSGCVFHAIEITCCTPLRSLIPFY
jgi:hypothetical protein